MNLAHRWHRLKRVSIAAWPTLLAVRLSAKACTVQERLGFGANGADPEAILHPLGLFRDEEISADAALLQKADGAIKGIFDLLGSGPKDFKGKIPWHTDFKSGHSWDAATFYADIKIAPVLGADIKVPWELSRCQHFVTLGQAYRTTRDEKYARAFFEQWEDWHRTNPVRRGVNWASAMDVALRLCNWLAAWELVRGSTFAPDGFLQRFTTSIHTHGRHLLRHLEYGGNVSTNHYLSNLLGIAYAGQALNNSQWMNFARREMESQILKQTHADGMDYEGSTAYHRLVTEIFHYYARVAAGSTSKAFNTRLELMRAAARALTMSNGRVPLIGDNDSGHVHVLVSRDDNDFSHLFDAGTVSSPMGDSGLFILRGEQDDLCFVAQPNGTRGVGNHTHNDKLSFTLTVKGDEFLVDPGSPVYTANAGRRNHFRSTAMHNTVEVDGEEQNRFVPGSLFSLHDDALVTVDEHLVDQKISAHHTGYTRLKKPVVHRRTVERRSSPLSWIINDHLEGEGEHDLRWSFIVGLTIRVQPISRNRLRLVGKEGTVELTSEAPFSVFNVEEAEVSTAYGVLRPARVARISMRTPIPFQARFILEWKN